MLEDMTYQEEIARRRTFAIISHPDAGKTTLTEKFLLYGGALHLAGSVKARKQQRSATSDWMELERKRGISITSTVLQLDYRGYRINLLDTPGHEDFSEDTYRVLTAVDAVIMVIDAAKGIEAQTRKLFEVCRRRHIPIFTFMNKMDRPTREPIDLVDELESVLGIGAYPVNWPLGTGTAFSGVFDRQESKVHLFERTEHGKYKAPVTITDLGDSVVRDRLSDDAYAALTEEIEMLDGAGHSFDRDAVLNGKLTPVFFGSASNNFGVQLLLDAFLDLSTPPLPRIAGDALISPDDERFSGFIFKIQANMDPRHRDRIAFMRVCSGKFTRDMQVIHVPSGKKVRLSNSNSLFGQQRETVDEAYPGDIVGMVGHTDFGIGDTLADDPAIEYKEIPHFMPECFAYLHNPNPSKYKRFRDGLDQLMQEGVVQAYYDLKSHQRTPILGAVGPLQFDVVVYRMESEYGAESRLEHRDWNIQRWVDPSVSEDTLKSMMLPSGSVAAEDGDGNKVIIFNGDWAVRYFQEKYPDIQLSELPFTSALLVA